MFASSAPPAVGVNTNVTLTLLLPGTRSTLAIANKTFVTCPPITPDATPEDTVGSALVTTVIPFKLPPVAAPMVRPDTITITAVLALIARVAVVTTI